MTARNLLLLSFAITSAVAGAIPIPSDPQHVQSLDGTWRFKLEQSSTSPERSSLRSGTDPIILPPNPIPFHTLDYKEDSSWSDITVPGNWEMQGLSPATYNQPDNCIGLYRLSFDVPADWKNRIVKINFDGVQNGSEFYINGQPANVDDPSWNRPNYHEGGYQAFQVDITTGTKFGEKNLLAIRVTKNTPTVDIDTGDYFFLGGVHRTVTMFSVPAAHIADWKVESKVPESGPAEMTVLVDVNSAAAAAEVSVTLGDQAPQKAKADANGRATLKQTVTDARLWSAEHPNLYPLTIQLGDGSGKALEQIKTNVGIREVAIRNGVFMINNKPVKFTGMCRHDLATTLGSALDEATWRKDILMMKAANVNAIRTSHYPYGEGFYKLCDELGMYVAAETAGCWFATTNTEWAPAFAQRARELVRRDKNHPAVILWAIGNENKPGPLNRIAAEEIAKQDSTRPRLVSWRKAEESGVELDDLHYTEPDKVAASNLGARRNTIPITYLENPNDWDIRNGADFGSTDRWGAVLDRVWAVTWDAQHIPGQFLWEWADRAVADKCPTKLYDYYPQTGINLAKTKGIVDVDRNPRPWYYHVKMAYAPIRLDLQPTVNGATVSFKASNYYSFTDLKELTTRWQLVKEGKPAASGTSQLALAPLTSGTLQIALPNGAGDADALRLTFDQQDGRNVVTYDLPLKAAQAQAAPTGGPADVKFPAFNMTAINIYRNRIDWKYCERRPVLLANIRVQSTSAADQWTSVADEAALRAMPLAQVRAIEADLAYAQQSKTPNLAQSRYGAVGDKLLTNVLELERDLTFLNKPQAAISGHLSAQVNGPDFKYDLTWNDKKADIQELGWIFSLPSSADHFSWDRHGYWSYYPDDHIGRLRGTATPDSANGVHVTRAPRLDAFDFNSTKYNCNWASLADTSGKGVRVSFASDALQHCRGGQGWDGSMLLFVNQQCSPPRDLSTAVVPDYYLTLDRGGKVSSHFNVSAAAK